MTDQDLTAPESVADLIQFIEHNEVYEKLEDADKEAYRQSKATLRALSAALEAERARADAAEARERALLQSNDQERKALVENTSLRSRLKAAEAKLKEAVDVATRLADWIEHEAGCELPFDARAALRDMEGGK